MSTETTEAASSASTSTTETTGGETSSGEASQATSAGGGGGDERARLIAAAKAAAPAEAASDGTNSAADEEVTAAEGMGTGTEQAPGKAAKPSIEDILRGREAKQEQRDLAAETERIRAEAAADREAAKREREEAAADRALLAKLKKNPVEAMKELGWTGEQFIEEVTREGTPEWKAMKRLEAENEALRAKTEKFEQFLDAQQKKELAAAERTQAAAQQAELKDTEQKFLSMVPEGSAMRLLYDDDEIILQGHKLAYDLRQKSGGQLLASYEDLRDYLEKKATQKLAKVLESRSGQPSEKSAPAQSSGSTKAAPQKPGTGSRTLSTSSASERRASPKPIREMSPAEEREALIAAAKAASGS